MPSSKATTPGKGKPAAKPPVAKPKKPMKSQERIVESDTTDTDEIEETTEFETTTGKSATSSSESFSSSGSSNEDEEAAEEEAAIAKSSYVYTPPPTFKPLPPPPSSSSSSNPFSAANLSGKELWFITAPVAAPLSKLDVVNPADIAEGVPVLQTSSGRSYCLRPKDENEGVMLAVQDGKGGYRIASTQVTKSFQLVEALPKMEAVEVQRERPVRAQPEGLWMRFKPIGYEGRMDEDANVEVEVRPQNVKGSEEDGEHKRKKRRSEKEEGRKEKKKHRSEKHHHHKAKEGVQV